MHHHIVLKVWADDEETAQSECSSALEDSVNDSENTCGWDYTSGDGPTLITKDMLQSEYSVQSYVELEAKMKQEQKDSMDNLIGELKGDLKVLIAPYFLTKKDAPLYVGTEEEDKDFMDQVEKVLKRKRDVKVPDSFEALLETMTKVVASIAKKDTGRSLTMYHMEQIKKLQYCIESPMETCYTLQCHENPYAELPCEDKEGKFAFYFIGDRHF